MPLVDPQSTNLGVGSSNLPRCANYIKELDANPSRSCRGRLRIGCADDQAGPSLARVRPPRLSRVSLAFHRPSVAWQARAQDFLLAPPLRTLTNGVEHVPLPRRALSFDQRADQSAGAQPAHSPAWPWRLSAEGEECPCTNT